MNLKQLALLKTILPTLRSSFVHEHEDGKDFDILLRDLETDFRVLELNRMPFDLVDMNADDTGGHPPIDSALLDAPSDIDYENYVTLSQWLQPWLENARLCAPFVTSDFSLKDSNAHLFPSVVKPEDPTLAVVLGSGASLNETAPFLKDFPGYILSGPSNAPVVAALGKPPHAILGIDSGFGTLLHLKSAPFADLGCHLITNPTIAPGVLELFPPEKRWWFLSMIQMGRGAQHSWNLFMKMLYMPVNSWMYQAGCTVNAEISTLHLFEVMNQARFRAVYLLGTDFSYKKGATRCQSYAFDPGREEWYPRDIAQPSNSIYTNTPLRRALNGMVSDEAMLGYKRSLLTLWAMTRLPLYDASDGIITEIPKVSFSSYADGSTVPESYSDESILKSVQEYFLKTGYEEGKSSGSEGKPIEGDVF